MNKKEPPLAKLLAELPDSEKPLVSTKLAYLSDLSSSETKLFRQVWAKITPERQYQILSHLIQISESNPKLDFDNIFGLCLQASDERVRLQAIVGLAATEDASFVRPLIHLMETDEAETVRAAAAVVLGNFALLAELGKLSSTCGAQIYSALIGVLEGEGESVTVKRRALEAVAPFSLPQVEESINQAYHSNDVRLKASAIHAMGRNCDLKWLPIVTKELSNCEVEIRYEAAEACGELEAKEAVPYLISLVDDEVAQVSEAAIRALGKIGGEEAKETLHSLLSSPEETIRKAAKAALAELAFWEELL